MPVPMSTMAIARSINANYNMGFFTGKSIHGDHSRNHYRRRRRRSRPGSSPPTSMSSTIYRHSCCYRLVLLTIAICRLGSSSLSSAFSPPKIHTAVSSHGHRRICGGGKCSNKHLRRSRPSTVLVLSMLADCNDNNNNADGGGGFIAVKDSPSSITTAVEIDPSSVTAASSSSKPPPSSSTTSSNSENNKQNNIRSNIKNRSNHRNNQSSKKNPTYTNESNKNSFVQTEASNEQSKRRRQPSSYSSSFSSQSRRPYVDLSIDKLRQLTEYHLSRNIRPDGSLSLGTMTPGQRHEFARLIASWSKLSVVQSKSNLSSPSSSSSMKNANCTITYSTKSSNATTYVPQLSTVSLTGEEKLLAAEMAEQCLRELIEEENVSLSTSVNASSASSSSSAITPPDLYYLVIKARLDVGKGRGGKIGGKGNSSYRALRHATSLLDLMERQQRKRRQQCLGQHQQHTQKQKQYLKPSLSPLLSVMKCYTVVLDGWCKSKTPRSESRAEELLRRMMKTMAMTIVERGYSGGGVVDEAAGVGLVRQYNNVMNRIATSGKPNAGAEAERLLYELIAASSLSSSSSPSYSLDNVPCTAVSTTACSSPSTARAPPPALRPLLAPDRISFNTVIKAYANAGGEHAVANAERILSVMENYRPPSSQKPSVRKVTNTAPDKISYTSVLMSYASSCSNRNSVDAGERAEELLERMTKLHEDGGGGVGDDVKPDTVIYNAVLKVWGKCGHPDAVERSEALLDKMLSMSETGGPEIIPDDVTFNTVMHTIANSHAADSPRRAMALLERMERLYESGKLVGAKPDIVSYNSVLDALAKSGGGRESARLAEEMLDDLEELYNSRRQRRRNRSAGGGGGGLGGSIVGTASSLDIRPDVYSYNIVIGAWANCGYANRAVSLLDRMTRQANKGRTSLRPDATTYNSVLHAWSQSSDRNAAVKALGLLEIMLRLRESGGGGGGGGWGGGEAAAANFPDVLSFSTVINAFSKSKYPRKARQSRDLLKRMKHLYETGGRREEMRPNVYVYSAVLNACAYTFGRLEEKEEALQIGIETYDELRMSGTSSPDDDENDADGMTANHVAYGSFIRLCRRLMAEDDPRREELITTAFQDCCDDGQLGDYVLRQLRPISGLYTSLLGPYIQNEDGEVRYHDLPSEWKRNVKEKTRPRSIAVGYSGLNRRKERR